MLAYAPTMLNIQLMRAPTMPLHPDTMSMRAPTMPLHPDTMLMRASRMPLHPDTMLMRALTMPLHPDTMLLHPPALKTLRFLAKLYLEEFRIEKLFHSERTLKGKSFYWLLSLIYCVSTSAAIIFLYPLPVF
ncbi:hypothetical protein NSTC731_03810 [Nostoc sp. DSM 114167]|jgi:hypothetical protein